MISNYILIAVSRYKKTNSVYKALAEALMIWTLHIYAWALILSIFNSLGYAQISVLYFLSNAYMITRIVMTRDHIFSAFCLKAKKYMKEQIADIRKNKADTLITLFIICFVIGVGVVACFAIPYNYDSVDYHAPRICQWVQNKSVFYYASHVTRQNFSTILAAYVATFAYILTFEWTSSMCLIQYGAYVINLGLILYLCRYFGVRRRIRQMAAILWITLPIGFAEAITPQNDQCAALWLLIFVIELIQFIDRIEDTGVKERISEIVVLAVCIALAYLTKPAVCFAILVFLFWYLMVCIKSKTSIRSIFIQCITAGLVILFLICPQMIQNYMVLGTVAADNVGKYQLIGTLRPGYVFINMIKNLAFNLGFRFGQLTNENHIVGFIGKFAALLNVDINHQDISEGGLPYGFPTLPCYTCDAGLNFTVYIFSIIAAGVFIYYLIKKKNKHVSIDSYIICSFASLVLLCFFLRWERSITRYMIGYFALLIIAVAVIVSRIYSGDIHGKRKIGISFYLGGVLFSVMVFTDIYFELSDLVKLHPVFPGKSELTMYNEQLNDYKEACNYINGLGIRNLGLIEGECPSEFAIWQMLNDDIVIKHVNLDLDNPFVVLENNADNPEVILSSLDDSDTISCHNHNYLRAYSNDRWSVYIRENG